METYLTTFEPYKNRLIKPGARVQVYRNLNKPGVVYSIRDRLTRLVIGHASKMLLVNCKMVVHAGDDKMFNDGLLIGYNPYKNEEFVDLKYKEPIPFAHIVYIEDGQLWAHGVEERNHGI